MSVQGLAASERIRRRPEFERVYNGGQRIHGRYMTLFILPTDAGAPRFGVAATRKLGSAVERNRAKRLSRELFRRRKQIGGVDIVIVPRREMLDAPFSTLESDYSSLLDRSRRGHGRAAAVGRRGARTGTATSV